MRRLGATGRCGVFIVGVLVAFAVFSPLLSRYGPTQVDSAHTLLPPSLAHPMGTDQLGMDLLARITYAPRIDLVIAFSATVFAMVLGIPLGTIAGIDEDRGLLQSALAQVIMRSMDVLQSIPVFVFALAVVAVLGSGTVNVILALAFAQAPVFVRLVRAEVLVIRTRGFVEAAELAGWGPVRTAFRHILPNAVTPSIAQASVVLGYDILLTAGLSFVGAGVQPPTPEWGVMISSGAAYLATGQWWMAIFPGVAIAVTVLGFSLLGEGLHRLVAEGGFRVRLTGSAWARGAFKETPA